MRGRDFHRACTKLRVRPVFGDDGHFAWSRHHVDVDGAVNLPFRRLNVLIAGADDLLNTRNRRSSISVSRYRMRTANAINLRQVQKLQRGSDEWIFFQ